jgi:protein disulfide-isomerase
MIKRSLKIASVVALAAGGMILAGCNKTEPTVASADIKTEWLTDYPKAQALAKQENKVILLDFTGSDFCIGCQSLKKQVWSQPVFAQFAQKNLVLVELDFPMNLQQPEELVKANLALESQFKVVGYPTIIMVDANGKEIFREEGYDDSPAKEYVAKLRTALSKK